ncbi:MAG TPA: bifunctional 4-hydroxy-2-oxoglutarate aldolase/2-dehydro-3-deoxy-phosphogluconate aldolase [Candidatus Limnocylindria bacterium]|nr:bifunctional 4-hydroxy-2-oxoglutarate aldolase/2-dehydro-3-deoxy-phosphogluconate aldolase [Candidatus Limnocylindria bacterium]
MNEPRALTELRERKLVAAIRAGSTAAALGAANAIAEGGVTMLEITFTVPGAAQAIAEIAGRPDLTVGAGTVLTADQAHDAIAAGAEFIIAPNLSYEVARIALQAGVLYCPGAYTTTEILTARSAGAHLIKVYPVGVAGGPDYIRVIRDPLPDVPMLAAGGTNLDNVGPFLEAGCVAIGLGAALCDAKLVAAGKFDQLTKRAREFVKRVGATVKTGALIGGLGLAGLASPGADLARAGTEEFSTFDVEAQEEDDESLLDHMLLRLPRSWRSEWERAPQAIRTSQGCLTSGQWFIDTDLKLRAPLGMRARMGLDLRQSESDNASYDFLDFSFQFPTGWGTPGFMFRPLFDKSRQDLALTWDFGADTSAFQLQTAFTFEDMFNNLWAFRQTRVGELSEPYERHPYEPGLRFVHRGQRVRVELGGRYLTPSRKSVAPLQAGGVTRLETLWGTLGFMAVEARAFGIDWEARGVNHQAASSDVPIDRSSGDARNFRRKWAGEVAAGRELVPRLTAELRWLYQERDQGVGAPLGPGAFAAVDRLLQLDASYALNPTISARVGGLFDRITVAQSGTARFPSYGTRNESRAYFGLAMRFGRVTIQGVEGVEIDPEPYEVWLVHDKGFLHLQTTF